MSVFDAADDELGLQDDEKQQSAPRARIAAPSAAAEGMPAVTARGLGPAAIPARPSSGITPQGISPQTRQRTIGSENELNRLENTGSGISQLQHGSPIGGAGIAKPHRVVGGILRGLDIAGSIAAPAIAVQIPGSTLHHQALIGQKRQALGQNLGEETAEAGVGEKEATAAKDAAAANATNRGDALTRALLTKGYTLSTDPTTRTGTQRYPWLPA
jgi:hypothetical protein